MARENRPDETAKTGSGQPASAGGGDEDLERRRLRLEASLATRRPESRDGKDNPKPAGMTGVGAALKLSSEFIAGIAVGVGIGWADRPLGRHLALGTDRLSAARLRCGGVERAAVGRDGSRARVEAAARRMAAQAETARMLRRPANIEGSRVSNDPIHQFQISKLIPIEIGGLDLSFTNSSAFMAATCDRRRRVPVPQHLQPRACADAHAVAGGNVLRIRRLDAARCRRQAGHAVLPVRLFAVHVRAVRQPVRPVPLFLHRHQPHHRHLRAGRSW